MLNYFSVSEVKGGALIESSCCFLQELSCSPNSSLSLGTQTRLHFWWENVNKPVTLSWCRASVSQRPFAHGLKSSLRRLSPLCPHFTTPSLPFPTSAFYRSHAPEVELRSSKMRFVLSSPGPVSGSLVIYEVWLSQVFRNRITKTIHQLRISDD